jgi:GT2 family glycosyltransferase
MSTLVVEPCAVPERQQDIAIAIPARNEADMIGACLAAIDASVAHARQQRVRATVLVNNSTDATAARARAFRSRHMRVHVVEVALPRNEAHAGGARRRALELALASMPTADIVMTTDADSRVDCTWIAANLVELEAGADAVAGVVTFRPDVDLPIAPVRHAEWQLAGLQARLHSLLDPRPQERWPTHIWAWGASLAVRADVYRAVGGLPAVPLAEDRAFADTLDRHGFRVRRSHLPLVITSHRRQGRAPGGLADLLAAYAHDEMPCDAALEPTAVLVRRLAWRAHLRAHHASAGAQLTERMARRLSIAPDALPTDPSPSFGLWWASIEKLSGRLGRRRVMPQSLNAEIARAERLIRLIERRDRSAGAPAHRADSPAFAAGEAA